MPTATFDVESIKNSIVGKLQRYYGITVPEATPQQLYRAVASTARDQIMDRWMVSRKKRHEQHGKRVYYLSVEFLMGRSLNCNLINLCSQNLYAKALDELGIKLSDVLPEEPEPAPGQRRSGPSGSLLHGQSGQLKACPPWAATIRYEYGLFRQKMVDGQQVELPDNWLDNGNVWEIAATEDTVRGSVRRPCRAVRGKRPANATAPSGTTPPSTPCPTICPSSAMITTCVNTLRTVERPQPAAHRPALLRRGRVHEGHGRNADGRGHLQGAVPRGQALRGQDAAAEAALLLHQRLPAVRTEGLQEVLRQQLGSAAGQGASSTSTTPIPAWPFPS